MTTLISISPIVAFVIGVCMTQTRLPVKFFSSHYRSTPIALSWHELSLSMYQELDYELLSEMIREFELRKSLIGAAEIIDLFRIPLDLFDRTPKAYRQGFE